MVVLTAVSAGTALLGGIFGGLGKQANAKTQNRIKDAQYKNQKAQANAQYEIEKSRAAQQWAWDMARTEQLRQVEAQSAVDAAERGALVIESAIENYEINEGALRDQYVVQERLRAEATGMEFDYGQQKLNDDIARQTAGYMRSIQQRGLEAAVTTSQAERTADELQQSLLLDQQKDYLTYNVQKAAALLKDSGAKARYSARQGGGVTSKRLAMDAGQKLGRLAAELEYKSRDRSNRLAMLNKSMTGETANRLGILALQAEDDANAMQYSIDRFGANSTLQRNQLENLTIPTFALGERQYGRELRALEVQTDATITQAQQPYRQKEYMDPVKPIAGLRPSTLPPIPIAGPSTLSVIGNSLMAGVQGAMSGYDPKTKTFN
jgi:hypothetical protein